MKIMLVNFLKVVNSAGGAERVFCNMSNEFVRRGYEVYAVCCDWEDGTPFYELDGRVNFINIDASGTDKKFAKYLKIAREILRFFKKTSNDNPYDNKKNKYWSIKLRKVLDDIKPDIIIAYDLQSVCILKNILDIKIPVIAMFHSNAHMILEKYGSKLELKALNKVNCVQVLLKSDKVIAEKYLNTKVVQIPNVIPQFVDCCNTEKKDIYKIIFIGRLNKKQKRPHLLIEAFTKIGKEFPDWKLEIWGGCEDKEYYNYLQNLVIKYQVNENIKICGSTNKVHRILLDGDIFAFPSLYEGFGLSLGEAMSAGLPCIGFKSCAAVNELIINNKTGILCEDSVDGLAAGLKKLMSNQNLRIKLGTAAKEEMKKYAAEKIWEKWENLLLKTLNW